MRGTAKGLDVHALEHVELPRAAPMPTSMVPSGAELAAGTLAFDFPSLRRWPGKSNAIRTLA
ncbi:hypothetical protein ITP53_24830 [Nonomuraea sp. K274]|uniref:Uncharacterized protein n=1 Tax=Nonomuraea cypriaca TaxID=1187855 RepID=A0A931F009_9ACTN|nr:hypothetical protein [Nonomuraea cypriaca]MBF8188900.1 hypothetical protein [Nonomuraea cypriaca]